jgi:hypothetical protein
MARRTTSTTWVEVGGWPVEEAIIDNVSAVFEDVDEGVHESTQTNILSVRFDDVVVSRDLSDILYIASEAADSMLIAAHPIIVLARPRCLQACEHGCASNCPMGPICGRPCKRIDGHDGWCDCLHHDDWQGSTSARICVPKCVMANEARVRTEDAYQLIAYRHAVVLDQFLAVGPTIADILEWTTPERVKIGGQLVEEAIIDAKHFQMPDTYNRSLGESLRMSGLLPPPIVAAVDRSADRSPQAEGALQASLFDEEIPGGHNRYGSEGPPIRLGFRSTCGGCQADYPDGVATPPLCDECGRWFCADCTRAGAIEPRRLCAYCSGETARFAHMRMSRRPLPAIPDTDIVLQRIHFTQVAVKRHFNSHQHTLLSSSLDLRTNAALELPPIDVVEVVVHPLGGFLGVGGVIRHDCIIYLAMDNRRLYCYRRAGRATAPCHFIGRLTWLEFLEAFESQERRGALAGVSARAALWHLRDLPSVVSHPIGIGFGIRRPLKLLREASGLRRLPVGGEGAFHMVSAVGRT